MNSLKQYLKDNYELEELRSLAEHGAESGFGDFIYYSDTTRYFHDYGNDCFQAVNDYNDATGFKALPEYVNNNSTDQVTFANSMVWFAIEWLASEIINESEN